MGTSTTATSMGTGNGTDNRQGTMSKEGQDAGMRETVDRVADSAADTASRLGDRAQDAVEQLSDTASQYASGFTETRDQYMEDAREYITQYPLRTVAIAAVTGFVLGRMMR